VPPADLERTDETGAAAAATYFLELYGYVMQTGDVATWDAMSWEQCEFCKSTRDVALAIASRGETFTGGDISALSSSVLPMDELLGGYPVDVSVEQGASKHHAETGELLGESTGRPGVVRVDTLPEADGWKILAVVSQEG